jgi:hypothetical protein
MQRVLRGLGVLGLLVIAACSGGPRVAPELQSMQAFAAYPGAVTVQEPFMGNSGFGSLGIQTSVYRVQRTTDSHEKIVAHYKRLAADNGWRFVEYVDPTGGPCSTPSYRFEMRARQYKVWTSIEGNFLYPNQVSEPCPDTPLPSFSPTPPPEGVESSPEPTPQPSFGPREFWYLNQNISTNEAIDLVSPAP